MTTRSTNMRSTSPQRHKGPKANEGERRQGLPPALSLYLSCRDFSLEACRKPPGDKGEMSQSEPRPQRSGVSGTAPLTPLRCGRGSVLRARLAGSGSQGPQEYGSGGEGTEQGGPAGPSA